MFVFLMLRSLFFPSLLFFFFFNDTATTEIYTLSLHDALPISTRLQRSFWGCPPPVRSPIRTHGPGGINTTASLSRTRSEEHTSELQSRQYLVCRLLLEKKKKTNKYKLTIQMYAEILTVI